MRNHNFIKSIVFFTRVIKKKPNFAEAWNKRATVYFMIGEFDKSMLDINQTLKLEPRHFGALDGMGLIFMHLKEYGEAIKIYDQMLPATIYDSVCGKPITDLIMHPYLTSDIIIKNMSYVDDPRADYIEIHIEQPRYFYCRGTGRYWVEE